MFCVPMGQLYSDSEHLCYCVMGRADIKKTGISLSADVLTEVDDRRHSNKPRSQWIEEAILKRLELENTGEWDGPTVGEKVEA